MNSTPTKCKHEDFEIRGSNKCTPPHGTCLQCGEETMLDELLNGWKARVEREIAEALTSIKLTKRRAAQKAAP